MADNSTAGEESLLSNQSYALQISIITILTIFSIFGTLGNGLVLYVFTKKNENVSTLLSITNMIMLYMYFGNIMFIVIRM